MAEMGISLLPEETDSGLDIQAKAPVLKDPDVLKSRIQKADYALGTHSPGQPELQADFWLGFEDHIRDQASVAEALDLKELQMGTVQELSQRAVKEGRTLTPDEQDQIMQMSRRELPSAATALEERYARRYMSEATKDDLVVASQEDPKGAAQIHDASRDVVTKQQLAQTIYQEIEQKYKDQSWGQFGVDLLKDSIPFYTWSKLHGATEGTGATSFLTGTNIAEQMRGLYFLPAEEFQARLKAAVDTIAQDNVGDALQFARAAVAYSGSDEMLNNLFNVGDVAAVGELAKIGAQTAGRQLARKSVGAIRESANPLMTSVDRQVVSGDAKGAAETGVLNKLNDVGAADGPNVSMARPGTRPARQLDEILHQGPGLLDPKNYLRSAGNLTEERQRRLLDALERNQAILKSSIQDVTHIVRVDDAAAQKGFQEAEAEFRRTYFRLEDSIVDVRPVRESVDAFGGADHIQVLLGRKDALPFVSAKQAETYASKFYKLPKGGYVIHEEGNNFFIGMEKNVREDSLDVLNLRIGTDNQSPETFINTWIGAIRNPDDVLSGRHAALRKQATYGGNAVMSRMSEVAQSLGAVSKNESERLGTILKEAQFKRREVINPDGTKDTVAGRFYHTVGDLDKAYLDRFNSLPSDKERQAYFSFRQLMDYDYAVRNISVYRDKARLGIDQKSVGWVTTDEAGKKVYKKTPFFEGRILNELPSRSGEPFTIGWVDSKAGKSNFMTSDSAGAYGKWKEIDELLAKDYKIIQVANPKEQALRETIDTGGEPLQYLIVRDLDEKPLQSVQVAWNEGGHWIYPSTGQYLKQAQTHATKFGRRIYDGDTTAHYFLTGGEQFRDAYEVGRQLIKQGVSDSVLAAHVESNLPYTAAEFRKLFRTGDNKAPFNLDTPFVLTRSGQNSSDIVKLENLFNQKIVDAGASEHSVLGKLNTQYAQERGERLTSVRNEGTEANPIFKLTAAPVMDPIDSLARSTSQLAKSRFYDDMKHAVVEDFASQFADAMNVPVQALRADPMRYLRDPVWKPGYQNASKMAAAKNTRRAILSILGEDTPDVKAFKWTKQKIIDDILRNKGGDTTLLDPWKWDAQADPTVVARSAVFHSKLGLFNVAQFPLQAQAVIHAAAVDGNPLRAVQANFLYWSMRMRGLAAEGRPQSALASGVSKALGIDKNTVEEMYSAWKNSGMNVVEGEYANLDDYLSPKMLLGPKGVRKALDVGTVFFKEGNNTHRGVSFATSFLAWRSANPTAKLDAVAMRKITERADLMYINMSRASNNQILQQGALSIPTQFFAYHARLTEQMLGKRLTLAEKARVMTLYSAAYGVPIGVGGTALGVFWPIHDSVRQAVLENGTNLSEPSISKFLMEGGSSMAVSMLTGEDFNFASRYGPNGMTMIPDLLDGKFLEVVAGASGSFMQQAWKTMQPAMFYAASVFGDDDDVYPLTKDDFIDVARDVSSLNSVAKAYYAYTTGMYLSTGDKTVKIADTDGLEAAMMGALGLTPQDVADTYLKLKSNKDAADVKKQIGELAVTNFIRGVKYAGEGDEKNSLLYYKRARTLMKGAGFDSQDMAAAYNRAIAQTAPLLDKVNRDFMLQDPEGRSDTYLDETLGDK